MGIRRWALVIGSWMWTIAVAFALQSRFVKDQQWEHGVRETLKHNPTARLYQDGLIRYGDQPDLNIPLDKRHK